MPLMKGAASVSPCASRVRGFMGGGRPNRWKINGHNPSAAGTVIAVRSPYEPRFLENVLISSRGNVHIGAQEGRVKKDLQRCRAENENRSIQAQLLFLDGLGESQQ
jgi:hypothetical protein